MNKLEKLKKLLEANYNFKGNRYEYFPKTNQELKQLVNGLIKQYGNEVDLNIVNVSNINDFDEIFKEYYTFNGNISEWDVSNGVKFYDMFYHCKSFNADLSNWNVSNGKYFSNMFYNCKKFDSDLSEWNVSEGLLFIGMFARCTKFNSDLSQWDVSEGGIFDSMFLDCKSFNADLSNWNVENAVRWKGFAKGSLLEKFPERIPRRFRGDYL